MRDRLATSRPPERVGEPIPVACATDYNRVQTAQILYRSDRGDSLPTGPFHEGVWEEGKPWNVSGVVEKRNQFLAENESGQWTMTELCRLYGITRPTRYAVLRRFAEQGERG